jgi:peptidyl-tRNA hydrolase
LNAPEARTPEEIAADPRVMYVVVRSDLKLNAGKVGASVGHAVQMLMEWYMPDIMGHRTSEECLLLAETREWLREDHPRYAKIVLGANSEEFTKVQLENDGFLVVDRGFTMVAPNTETAFGLYPMKKSEARGIVRTLKPLR